MKKFNFKMKRFKMNKKGNVGDIPILLFQLGLVSIVAIIILVLSSIFYDYYIDVRDFEAGILTRKVVDCLIEDGKINLDNFPQEAEKNIFDYCKIKNPERFYLEIVIASDLGTSNNLEKHLKHGNSGAKWIYELFNTAGVEKIKKYESGAYADLYPVKLIKNNKEIKGILGVGSLVEHEF